MIDFNKEGRKAGKELSADILPAFLLSLFNHPEPVARDAQGMNLLGIESELRSFAEF